MVSALSPLSGQSQQVDLAGALAGGQQAYQRKQLNDQAMQQNQQQISRADYEQGVERLKLINRLAVKVKELPSDKRYGFVNSLNQDMLKSVGIDPAQINSVQLDDQSLDALIATTGAALPEDFRKTRVQSTTKFKNGTIQQVLANGDTRVINPAGQEVEGAEAQKVIDDANKYEIGQSTQKAGGVADARNQSDLQYNPQIKGAETQAEINARIAGGGEAERIEAEATGRGKNVAEAEDRGNVRRETAASDYPKLEAQANNSIKLIDEILAHPGRDLATGVTSLVPGIPGTEQMGFIKRFDQIKGQAFLQAFESLKGGGAITQIEGEKATQAIDRMNRTTNAKEFDAAAADLKGVLERAKAVLADKAKAKPAKTTNSSNLTDEELLSKY